MTKGRIPHHVAIVMDGNGRWATRRYLPRVAGHKKGMDVLRACVRHCGERGVQVLTVFAFSSENWNRPAEEVSRRSHGSRRAVYVCTRPSEPGGRPA